MATLTFGQAPVGGQASNSLSAAYKKFVSRLGGLHNAVSTHRSTQRFSTMDADLLRRAGYPESAIRRIIESNFSASR